MRQPDGGLVREGVGEESGDAPMNAVARDLGRQGKINTLMVPGRDEPLSGVKRRLGFATTHRCFDDDEAGVIRNFDQSLLHRIGLEQPGGF